jgi:alpha/beta superfamily hydrolase
MENKNHHNLPIYNDKKGFNQLQAIIIKGLFVMGQKDGFAKQNTKRHLETINQYSKNKDNVIKVIENTGHTFRNREIELSKIIIDFVR